MQLPDSVRRALRTFVQAFIGVLLVQAAALIADLDDGEIDWNLWKRVALSALAAGFVAAVSYIQNALEDNTSFPAVLKSTPSPGLNPVTKDPAV